MRSIARHHEAAHDGAPKKDVLDRRLLAEGVSAALQGSPSRFILVVSARSGDGKTHLFSTLASVLAAAEPDAWRFLEARSAQRASPSDFPHGQRVIIDGAALLDGDGEIELNDEWMNALDGALIVLLAGRTTEDEVAQIRERLAGLGIPPVGVIWNDRDDGGLRSLLGSLRRRAAAVGQMFPGRRSEPPRATSSRVHVHTAPEGSAA